MSSNYGDIMISGVQIRGARAVLGWSSEDAAARLGISRQTLHRLESYDDVPPSRTYVIRGLRQVFEEAGVEFIGSPWDGPGVRLWKQIEPAP